MAASVVAAAIAGCGGTGGSPESGGGTEIVVVTAPSLTRTMGAAARAYEDGHPGVRVRTASAGPDLRATVIAAAADVLVSADAATMDALGAQVAGRRTIAHDQLTIVVPEGNPGHVRGLADLARPGVRLALAGPGGTAGRDARLALGRAGVPAPGDSAELDSADVLGRVQGGEADAGIVAVTDAARAGGAVETVPIPAPQNVVSTLSAATVTATRHSDLAGDFVRWLTTGPAQSILRAGGFKTAG